MLKQQAILAKIQLIQQQKLAHRKQTVLAEEAERKLAQQELKQKVAACLQSAASVSKTEARLQKEMEENLRRVQTRKDTASTMIEQHNLMQQ